MFMSVDITRLSNRPKSAGLDSCKVECGPYVKILDELLHKRII